MRIRGAMVCACVIATSSALAQDLAPDQTATFLVGKPFDFACYDGTVGTGRISADGALSGTIRIGPAGLPQSAEFPAGTVRMDGAAVCAHLPGVPITPCFKVQKIGANGFRGSITGLSLGSCDLYPHDGRARLIATGAGASP
jgi:hypothetical protein